MSVSEAVEQSDEPTFQRCPVAELRMMSDLPINKLHGNVRRFRAEVTFGLATRLKLSILEDLDNILVVRRDIARASLRNVCQKLGRWAVRPVSTLIATGMSDATWMPSTLDPFRLQRSLGRA